MWVPGGLASPYRIRWGLLHKALRPCSAKTSEVKEIVVGLPLRMSGAEGTQAEKMRAFAEELARKFGLPVHLWDERLTSAEANRFLRETELSIEKRGKAVDRMAAVLILQSWMEHRNSVFGSRLSASGTDV
jgi:putative transcription antitermination factor YqgF